MINDAPEKLDASFSSLCDNFQSSGLANVTFEVDFQHLSLLLLANGLVIESEMKHFMLVAFPNDYILSALS